MDPISKVTLQAKEAKKIFGGFLEALSETRRLDFCASFHLRPTSAGKTTIVSTLSIAPMRGIQDVSNAALPDLLVKLNAALPEINGLGKAAKPRLRALGFCERKSESAREEDAQAAFVRDVIRNQLEGFTFIATEFDLFGFGDKNHIKRPDVLVYRDGVLFDIELKNRRNGPRPDDIGYSPITQAAEYVSHMKDVRNFRHYADCLAAFPNSPIGEITDIRGIALVPATPGKSRGTLEAAAIERYIELWTFDSECKIEKLV